MSLSQDDAAGTYARLDPPSWGSLGLVGRIGAVRTWSVAHKSRGGFKSLRARQFHVDVVVKCRLT